MVHGVTVCGGFLTRRVLLCGVCCLVFLMVLGVAILIPGLVMRCYHYNHHNYYDSACYATQLYLIIDGGIIIGLSAIGLVVAAVLFCRMTDDSVRAAPNSTMQPCTVTPAYLHSTALYSGGAVSTATDPEQPQQYLSSASNSTEMNQGQFQENPMNKPQKQDPEAAQSTMQPPASQSNM